MAVVVRTLTFITFFPHRKSPTTTTPKHDPGQSGLRRRRASTHFALRPQSGQSSSQIQASFRRAPQIEKRSSVCRPCHWLVGRCWFLFVFQLAWSALSTESLCEIRPCTEYTHSVLRILWWIDTGPGGLAYVAVRCVSACHAASTSLFFSLMFRTGVRAERINILCNKKKGGNGRL